MGILCAYNEVNNGQYTRPLEEETTRTWLNP